MANGNSFNNGGSLGWTPPADRKQTETRLFRWLSALPASAWSVLAVLAVLAVPLTFYRT